MNTFYILQGNVQKIAKTLIDHRIEFAYRTMPTSVEFILTDYHDNVTFDDLLQKMGKRSTSIHSSFPTDKYTLHQLYR